MAPLSAQAYPLIITLCLPLTFINLVVVSHMFKKSYSIWSRSSVIISSAHIKLYPIHTSSNGLFDLPVKRKPAPRVFCDICDEFDAHETEDCPLQSSDSPPPITLPEMTSTANLISKDATKERKIPPPRKYCDTCEGKRFDWTLLMGVNWFVELIYSFRSWYEWMWQRRNVLIEWWTGDDAIISTLYLPNATSVCIRRCSVCVTIGFRSIFFLLVLT